MNGEKITYLVETLPGRIRSLGYTTEAQAIKVAKELLVEDKVDAATIYVIGPEADGRKPLPTLPKVRREQN